MNIAQLQLTPLSPTAGPPDANHKKIANAATQFEALLIGEMLKSVRESSDDGWLGGGSDSSAESAFGMAENQFAQTISERGGFGLAKTIEHSLEKSPQSISNTSTSQ